MNAQETKEKILVLIEDMLNKATLELMNETDERSRDYALIKALTLEMVKSDLLSLKVEK